MSVPQFTPCYCFAGSTTGSDGYRYCFNDWWGSETHICTRGERNATSTPKIVMKADSLQALHSGKGGRSTKAKLPGASLHSRVMQGSALRVGPVDILQTDVRPLPQLILSENKTTLLAEHRDLIIRVPGLNSFLSVCNVSPNPRYGHLPSGCDVMMLMLDLYTAGSLHTLVHPRWASWPTQRQFRAFPGFMLTAEEWTVHGLAWS